MKRSWGKVFFKVAGDESGSESSLKIPSMFQGMRAFDEVAPAPGFYKRVRSQIDESVQGSIWSPFLHSRLWSRLVAVGFVGTFILLGYVLAAEWNVNEADYLDEGSVALISTRGVERQRDSVLTQITTYNRPN
jgi:hypothetical protein